MSSISSIPAAAPAPTPDPSQPKTPDAGASDEARAAASQPPVLAALPPGQGTRIDQIA
jgi:hypothetical protein